MQPTSTSPSGRSYLVALIAVLSSVACETGPEAETGAFIVRLGTDTTAVERFELTADALRATAVVRTPEATVRQTEVSFGPDGAVQSYESTVRAAGAPEDTAPEGRTVMRFGTDSVTLEQTEEGETTTRTLPLASPMVPANFAHFSLEELRIRRALEGGHDTVYQPGEEPAPVVVRRTAPDSVLLETGGLGTWRARVDEEGRILSMDAGALGRTIERAPTLDVAAIAERWVGEYARGEGMGPLSPRDTVAATVHGARITIDYSRPSKRGRQVFGGLVAWGEVWRTGANVATHFTTDRPLDLAGNRIPAATYTLFTIPRPDEWTLIINRQTGQAGTTYDEAQDLTRVSLRVEELTEPVERFTIRVEETDRGGVLALLWDRTRASVPFGVGTE